LGAVGFQVRPIAAASVCGVGRNDASTAIGQVNDDPTAGENYAYAGCF